MRSLHPPSTHLNEFRPCACLLDSRSLIALANVVAVGRLCKECAKVPPTNLQYWISLTCCSIVGSAMLRSFVTRTPARIISKRYTTA